MNGLPQGQQEKTNNVSIREQIASLEELSALDVELKRIGEQLEKHHKGLTGMQTEVKSLEDRARVDRETLNAMDKTRGELVGELRTMIQQIDRSREKLQRSRNERESNAAQREVEELRKLHRDREDELERLNIASESARLGIEETDKKRTAISNELSGSADGITSTMAELEAEKAEKNAARARVVARLPVVLYRRYESIRTKRPIAIAKTYDGTCLGCHLSVPPMMFQKMRRQQEFEQCPHCRRILYYVPPETKGDALDDSAKS
jgi:predicted  nucleic acid-binding Zn-ribbon protein